MRLEAFLKSGEITLAAAGLEDPRQEAEFLCSELLGWSRLEFWRAPLREIPESSLPSLKEGLLQRARRRPLAYIAGFQPFLDMRLRVNEEVLIPRPETEQLAEMLLRGLHQVRGSVTVIDVGTGSGALALALAQHPHVQKVYGIDRSASALRIACENSLTLGLLDKCQWVLSDGLNVPSQEGPFWIVANLPYVRTADLSALAPELAWEPVTALDGGPDGLVVIKQVIAQAEAFYSVGTMLVLEIGCDQGAAVVERLRSTKRWGDIHLEPDLSGRDRFVFASRKDGSWIS